jgi:two-component system sensor histidine kinase PilS (NtrC family)
MEGLPDEAGKVRRLAGDLYGKLVLLTGIRLLVGTALLVATAFLTLRSGILPAGAAAALYWIVGAVYLGTLLSVLLLRERRHLGGLAYGHIVGDLLAATLFVYLTGGAESIFTILYPLAIVNGAIGLGKRGAAISSLGAAALFCGVVLGIEAGLLPPVETYFARVPLTPAGLALVLLTNLSAFALSGALAAFLAEQLRGARQQLAERETRLVAVEAIFSAVVQSISSGIVTVDHLGRITYLNPAGAEIVGMTDEQVHGKPLSEVLGALAEAIAHPPRTTRQRNEVQVQTPSGQERVLGWAWAPLAGEAKGQVVVFQDLTEFRRMEEAVRRSDRLAVVGELAAGLAHEIRNPLAAMCGSIDLLGTDDQFGEEQKQLLRVVHGEAQRLEALVRDFLSFARPTSPQIAPFDGERLVAATVGLFTQDVTARGIEISYDAPPGVWLRADESQMKQVLWNLLGNAVDATPPGGSVHVRLRGSVDQALLEVQDSGAGIAPEDLPRIFDPFFTTKPGGTGLGLAIVHRIVEAHGGRVVVHSDPVKGSTFAVWVPLAPAAVPSQTAG